MSENPVTALADTTQHIITDGYKRHLLITKNALAKFADNDGMTVAGNMAFLAVLSLFPFLIFLIAVSGLIGQTDRGIEAIELLMSVMPSEVSSVLAGPIQGILKNTRPEILTGSILFAIWTAANGVEAARHAILKAFGREHMPAIWLRRVESLGVVILGAILAIMTMSIMVVGPALFSNLLSYFPDMEGDFFGIDIKGIFNIWQYLNLLVSPLLLIFGAYVVFMVLSPRTVKKPYRLPGAIFCVSVLVLTAKGLSLYLKYSGTYDVTYGSLAGIVITLLFCFLASAGFILGAELNAAYTMNAKARFKAQILQEIDNEEQRQQQAQTDED